MNDEIRAQRVAALDAFVADVGALLAGSALEGDTPYLAGWAAARPTLAVRTWSDDPGPVPALLAASLPGVEVISPAVGGPAMPDAGCDWLAVVAPVFHPADPDALGKLIRRTAGAHARATVVIDIGRFGDVSVGEDAPVCRYAADDPALRLVARRFVAADVDLWRRAVGLTDADGRGLAALAMGDRAALEADLVDAGRFVGGDVGRAGEVRARAFERFGMVGLRRALADPASLRSAEILRSTLAAGAGAPAVVSSLWRDLVGSWPAPRELRVAGATAALVESLRLHDRGRARDLAERLHRFEQGSEAVLADALRRWFDLAPIPLRADLLTSLRRVVEGSSMQERIGVADGATPMEALVAAAQGAETWRSLAASPFADPATVTFADAVARWFEVVCVVVTPGARR